MNSALAGSARRVLALLALLATASGVVAPACGAMTMRQASAQHCGTGTGHDAPGSGTSHGPAGSHQTPASCTMGICIPFAMPALIPQARALPDLIVVRSTSAALTSAAPQHTTPPPRS